MNYLIPLFDCILFSSAFYNLKANVKYCFDSFDDFALVFGNANELPFIFNKESNNVLKITDKNDNYYFLFPTRINDFFTTKFVFKSKEFIISKSNKLLITCEGVLICEENVDNINFSHFEIVDNFCFIYFNGNRRYLVILENDEICFSGYYDECNISEERFYMSRQNDSLNHGLVCHIKEKKFEKYLVYLDDAEMNLKVEFLPLVFLDCIKAKNFKYANELLVEDLKLNQLEDFENFFSTFDYVYPLNETRIVLLNKNTLAGIYEFSIENNKICNIKNLH